MPSLAGLGLEVLVLERYLYLCGRVRDEASLLRDSRWFCVEE